MLTNNEIFIHSFNPNVRFVKEDSFVEFEFGKGDLSIEIDGDILELSDAATIYFNSSAKRLENLFYTFLFEKEIEADFPITLHDLAAQSNINKYFKTFIADFYLKHFKEQGYFVAVPEETVLKDFASEDSPLESAQNNIIFLYSSVLHYKEVFLEEMQEDLAFMREAYNEERTNIFRLVKKVLQSEKTIGIFWNIIFENDTFLMSTHDEYIKWRSDVEKSLK